MNMMKYFDSTFFKFLIGFLVILAISFAILIATQYYEGNREPSPTYVQSDTETVN
jgi:hypothetical protein